jgi:hypothetical protein
MERELVIKTRPGWIVSAKAGLGALSALRKI